MPLDDESLQLPGRLEKSSDYTYYLPRDSDRPDSHSFRDHDELLKSRRFAEHSFSAACSGQVYSPQHEPKYDRRSS